MTSLAHSPGHLTERWQQSIYHITQTLGRRMAGLQAKWIDIKPGSRFCYYDNNNTRATDTLVLVHGFNADKDHWLAMARHLRQFRVIIPDLGGHGESCYDPALTYDIARYASQLNQLLQAIGIESCHLLGNSMGGWIVGHYAHAYPGMVKSLALMNACGVTSPRLSPYFNALAQRHNHFFYTCPAEFDALLRISVARPHAIPKALRDVAFRNGLARMEKARKLFADITNAEQTWIDPAQMLDNRLAAIGQPALVLWGDRDGIMDPSMLHIFRARLRYSKAIIMTDVGHTPMLEKPRLAAFHYTTFLQDCQNMLTQQPPFISPAE